MTRRVLITTSPFGEGDPKALRLLEEEGIAYTLNPFGRRLREQELADFIEPYEVVIAELNRSPKPFSIVPHTCA